MPDEYTAEKIERFWGRVDRSGGPDACWPWTRYCDPAGYGRLYFQGNSFYAHRFAFIVSHGTIPEGLHICHTCDNPPCCNPAHLWAGTARDNAHDAQEKGRRLKPNPNPKKRYQATGNYPCKGTTHGRAKLTNDDVRAIRQLCRDGVRHEDIAIRFGVSASLISEINTRKIWRHI